MFELSNVLFEFPMYLPYSMMVKQIIDLLSSGISDIFKYWANLIENDNDLSLFYLSVDRMITWVIEILETMFIHTMKLNIA